MQGRAHSAGVSSRVVIHSDDEDLLPVLEAAFSRVGLAPEVVDGWPDSATDPAGVLLVTVSAGSDWQLVEQLAGTGQSVVALLSRVAPALFRRALAAGATGVAVRTDSPVQIARVVQAAASGYALVRAAMLHTERVPAPLLARDERALLRGFAEGLSAEELAAQQGCSERTIYRRLRRVCSRLDASSRGEAIAVARRMGLLKVALA